MTQFHPIVVEMPEHKDTVKFCVDISLSVFTGLLALGTGVLAWYTAGVAKETKALAEDANASSYRQIGVQTWLILIEKFESLQMRTKRAEAAYFMQRIYENPSAPRFGIPYTILVFFENLGIAYLRNYIEQEMARETFGYHVKGWYVALFPTIQWIRHNTKSGPIPFTEFEKFALELDPEIHEKISGNSEEFRAIRTSFLVQEQLLTSKEHT